MAPDNPRSSPVATTADIGALPCGELRHVWNSGDPPSGTEWPHPASAPFGSNRAVADRIRAAVKLLTGIDAPTTGVIYETLNDDEVLGTGPTQALVRLIYAGASAELAVAVANRAASARGGECFESVGAKVLDFVTPNFTAAGIMVAAATVLLAALGITLIVIGTRQLAGSAREE